MEYQYPEIRDVRGKLLGMITGISDLAKERTVLNGPEMGSLYAAIRLKPENERPAFGLEVNQLKTELQSAFDALRAQQQEENTAPIDVTAPFDINVPAGRRPQLLPTEQGSRHPLMVERDNILDIFYRMGFSASESREIDDDYHMFTALNFPEGHPARDDYDTFMTEERLVAPAHTSTMQNRILKQRKADLEAGVPIAVVIPDRVFRNEDVDARHEHTFYQIEGIYVGTGIHVGHLIATLKEYLKAYYKRDLEVKIQPFYFPFTEPSFEFAASCPFCGQKGCNVCSYTGWFELGGCGMIHPNVLKEAGINPAEYTGFAWGFGIDRMVMIKHDIEDVRNFESGKLEFLRQFK